METVLFIIALLIYLLLGMVIAELKAKRDGYSIGMEDFDRIVVTLFWPLYTSWKALSLLAKQITLFFEK